MHGIISESDQIALYLEQAKAMIDHPDKWLKREYKSGDRRCAVQAIRDTFGDCYTPMYNKTLIALAGEHNEEGPETAICNHNDSFVHHSEVMNYFDTAIAKLRSLSMLRTSV